MALTDTAVSRAKPGKTPVKLSDERGLFLLIAPSGGKWWRQSYRFAGKQKTISLGTYPAVSLKAARKRRDEARELLAQGIDPSENRKAVKAANAERDSNSFEAIAREWFAKHSPSWAVTHADKIIQRLERDVFPALGAKAVAEITAPELLAALRRIESRGALETAHRTLSNCGQVFRYAVATGRAQRDPTGDLKGALPPYKRDHFAAVTEPKRVAELLRMFDGYRGTFVVACALRLAPLVFVRPGELRMAKWADVDLDAAQWSYTARKTDTPHIVPLATQAVAILRDLHAVTGSGVYLFPSARSRQRAMSDNAILAAMRRMGIAKDEMTGHGFRAMARTILDEVLGVRPDLIEHQLAHAVRDPLGRAYNRASFLPERRKMMQRWSDFLDKLKAGADVIQLRVEAA